MLNSKNQKIRIVSGRGTTSYFVNYSPKMGLFHPTLPVKTSKIQPSVKLVCHTCNADISQELSRFLVMHNQDNAPRLFSFHFFTPCWDSEKFFQKYSTWTLSRTGFSAPEKMSITEIGVNTLQSDESFWH